MVTAYDVERGKLIEKMKEKLKGMIEKPKWVDYVKSSSANERPPEEEDFYFKRAASILWQIYKNNIIGVNKLRRYYGKRKIRGVKPEQHRKAGGKIIRSILQQLEKIGFIEKVEKGEEKKIVVGRKLTSKGRSFVDNTAKESS